MTPTERQLALLRAAQDALEALRRAKSLVDNAMQRRRDGAQAEELLRELDLLLDPPALLARPIETQLVVGECERFYSGARMRHNERERRRYAERKGNGTDGEQSNDRG